MKVTVEKHNDTYWGTIIEVPGVITSCGDTLAELKENLHQAYADYYDLAVELEDEYVTELEKTPTFTYSLNLESIFNLLPEVKISSLPKRQTLIPPYYDNIKQVKQLLQKIRLKRF